MLKRLLAAALAITFLMATVLPGEFGVLCLMTETVQSHCCCHQNDVEGELPSPSIERTCCEIQVGQTDGLPSAVSANEIVIASVLLPSVFSPVVVPKTLSNQTTSVSSPARGPPRKIPAFITNCSFLI